MKNKRKAHGQIIEHFLEQSQQDEVIRHDLIDMHSVSMTYKIVLINNNYYPLIM